MINTNNQVEINGFTVQNGAELYGSGSIGGITIVGSNHIIKDNIFIGNEHPCPYPAVHHSSGNSLTIQDNEMYNWCQGIYLNPSNGHAITNNNFHNNVVGIGSDGISSVEVSSNIFKDNTAEGWGASAVGSNVRGHQNKFINTGKGIAQHSDSQIDGTNNWWGVAVPDFSAVVAGDVDYDPWYLDEAMSILSSSVDKATVYVDDGYTAGNTGGGKYFGFNAFAKIQEGITAVDVGGTVNVAAGIYNEHDITINKSLTLTGDPGDAQPGPGANAPVVDGQNLWKYGFKLANGVSNVTIQGFDIRNYVGTLTGDGDAIMAWVASTSHVTVNDNYMHNLTWNGVLVGNDGAIGDHSYWTIARNRLTDFGPSAFDTSGYGLELTNTSHGVIEDNIIDAGTGSHFPGTGILITMRRPSGQDILIQRNSVRGQFDFAGINVQASTQDVPSSNLDNVRILNNDVDISGTTIPALQIRNKFNGTVTNITISDNKLINAGGYGIKNLTTQLLNATANWWGTTNGTVIVLKVGGDVDYRPWCSEETCGSIDRTLPSIFSHIPSANAVGVNPSANIEVVFKEDVQCGSGAWTSCIAFGPAVSDGSINYDNKTLTFASPEGGLQSNTKYTVTLTGVEDISGNLLTGDKSWMFTTANQYSIPISAGWNFISIPTVPIDTSIDEVLGNTVANIVSVWTYDPVNYPDVPWRVYHPDGSEQSNLYDMTAGYGYWISAKDNPNIANIEGYGNLFSEQQTPPQRELTAGWNLIGYYQKEGVTSIPAKYALSTLADNYCEITTRYWTSLSGYDNSGKNFTEANWNSNMSPNDAYWIFMKSSSIGTYMYGPGESVQSCSE